MMDRVVRIDDDNTLLGNNKQPHQEQNERNNITRRVCSQPQADEVCGVSCARALRNPRSVRTAKTRELERWTMAAIGHLPMLVLLVTRT